MPKGRHSNGFHDEDLFRIVCVMVTKLAIMEIDSSDLHKSWGAAAYGGSSRQPDGGPAWR